MRLDELPWEAALRTIDIRRAEFGGKYAIYRELDGTYKIYLLGKQCIYRDLNTLAAQAVVYHLTQSGDAK